MSETRLAARLLRRHAIPRFAPTPNATPNAKRSARPSGPRARARPPKRVGRYRVTGELGRGAMGRVLAAHDDALDRAVAIKLPRHLGPRDLVRFRREATVLARLEHGAIVPVLDVGEHDGRPFIVMPRIPGGTIERAELDARGVARAGARVARALEHAHRAGVVHRDVKPGNVLVDGAGRAWLTDFGLARSRRASAGLTRDGAVVGTPGFAAPEQARGRAAVPASDVFALGATLYRVLTGAAPFQGADLWETLRATIEREPVPPRRLAPATPRALEAIVLRALRKDPASRYRDAAAMADDLERFLAGRPVAALEDAGSAWRRWARGVAGRAALALALILVIAIAPRLGAGPRPTATPAKTASTVAPRAPGTVVPRGVEANATADLAAVPVAPTATTTETAPSIDRAPVPVRLEDRPEFEEARAGDRAALADRETATLIDLLGSVLSRDAAAAALVERDPAEVVPAVTAAMLDLDRPTMVRYVAAQTLGSIGSAGAIPALIIALDDPHPNQSTFADAALRKLVGPDAETPRWTADRAELAAAWRSWSAGS